MVRRAHPSLTVVDRAKNLYEIEIMVPAAEADAAAGITSTKMSKYRSTLEGLLDFTAPSTAALNAADALKTETPIPRIMSRSHRCPRSVELAHRVG